MNHLNPTVMVKFRVKLLVHQKDHGWVVIIQNQIICMEQFF